MSVNEISMEKLFSNRFTLKFNDPEVDRKFNTFNKSSHVIPFIISFMSIVFCVVILIWLMLNRTDSLENDKKSNRALIITSACIIITSLLFLILSLFRKNLVNIRDCLAITSFTICFDLLIIQLNNGGRLENPLLINQISVFLMTFSHIIKFICMSNAELTAMLLSFILTLSLQWVGLLIIYGNNFAFIYISDILILITLAFYMYICKFILCLKFYSLIKSNLNSSSTLDIFRSAYFSLNMEGKFIHVNQPGMDLLSKSKCGKIKNKIPLSNKTEKDYLPNYLQSWLKNKFIHKTLTTIEDQNVSMEKVKSNSGIYQEEEDLLENFLQKLNFLNTDIHIPLLKLIDIKKNNENEKLFKLALLPKLFNLENGNSPTSSLGKKTKKKRESACTDNIPTILQINSTKMDSSYNNLLSGLSTSNKITLQGNCNYKYFGKVLEGVEEYHVFIRYNNDSNSIEIIIDDNTQLFKNERTNIVHSCKNLFLSKLSHEFRNPLSSIYELAHVIIEENLGHNNTKHSLLHSESYQKISSFRKHELLKLSSKNSLEKINHLEHIRTLCEIMMMILKDFTVYSNLDDKLVPNLEDASNKICPYRDIIKETFKMFTIKSNIENKDKKLELSLEFGDNLPEVIECDSDVFASFIFNFLNHIYKTTHLGKIILSVYNTDNKIKFELLVYGVTKSGLVRSFKKQSLKEKQLILSPCSSSVSEEKDDISVNDIVNNIADRQNCFNNYNDEINLENFNLLNLFNISDIHERDKLVEDFNNNFSAYMLKTYADKLGFKLNYTRMKNRLNIFFLTEGTNLQGIHNKKIDNIIRTGSIPYNDSNFINCKSKFFLSPVSKQRTSISMKTKFIANTGKPDPRQLIDRLSKTQIYRNTSSLNSKLTNKTLINQNALHINYSDINIYLNPIIQEFTSPRQIRFNVEDNSGREMNGISERNDDCMLSQIRKIKIGYLQTLKKKSSVNLFHKSSNHCVSIINSARSRTNKVEDPITDDNENLYRILLVDDECLVRKGLHRFLQNLEKEKQYSFEVLHAENGFEALGIIYNSHIEAKPIDIMIIDENMPFMKGSQIIRCLRIIFESGELLRFIMISYTSYDSAEKKQYLLSNGADFVWNKPLKFTDFKLFFKNAIKIKD